MKKERDFMNFIKRLISYAVVLVCVAVPINSFTPIDNNVNAAEEIAEPQIWDGTSDTSWYDDDETEFHISTAEELSGLFELLNVEKNMKGKTIYLENDILLNDVSNFENWDDENPQNIWKSNSLYYAFYGTFNGNGHTITGLFGSTGLFDYVGEGGKITNLKCDNSYVKGDGERIGGICNALRGKIRNCSFSGKVIYEKVFSSNKGRAYTCVGGICGFVNGGRIENCSSDANISVSFDCSKVDESVCKHEFDHLYAGGICGSAYYSCIKQCYSNGSVQAFRKSSSGEKELNISAGSICGRTEGKVSIESCYNIYDNCDIIAEVSYVKLNDGSKHRAYISNTYNTCGRISKNSYGMSNCYYLSGVANSDGGNAKAKTKANMQKPEFAETLGDAFVYVEGDYPKLAWELGILMTGDINDDGGIDISDAVLLQKYLLGAQQLTKEQYDAADVDKNGTTDVYDMVRMRQLIISEK